jgi:hypothetical protein
MSNIDTQQRTLEFIGSENFIEKAQIETIDQALVDSTVDALINPYQTGESFKTLRERNSHLIPDFTALAVELNRAKVTEQLEHEAGYLYGTAFQMVFMLHEQQKVSSEGAPSDKSEAIVQAFIQNLEHQFSPIGKYLEDSLPESIRSPESIGPFITKLVSGIDTPVLLPILTSNNPDAIRALPAILKALEKKISEALQAKVVGEPTFRAELQSQIESLVQAEMPFAITRHRDTIARAIQDDQPEKKQAITNFLGAFMKVYAVDETAQTN